MSVCLLLNYVIKVAESSTWRLYVKTSRMVVVDRVFSQNIDNLIIWTCMNIYSRHRSGLLGLLYRINFLFESRGMFVSTG